MADTQRKVRSLKRKYGPNCTYCEREMIFDTKQYHLHLPNYATLDHVRPKSQGGTARLDNLCLACSSCNNKRQTIPFLDFIFHINEQHKRFPKGES